MNQEVFCLLLFFWRRLLKSNIISSVNTQYNQPVNHLGLMLSSFERLLIIDFTSLIYIKEIHTDYSYNLFILGGVWQVMCFKEVIHKSKLSIYWAQSYTWHSFIIFLMSTESVVTFFLYLESFVSSLFFLWLAWLNVYQFYFYFQRMRFWSYWLPLLLYIQLHWHLL